MLDRNQAILLINELAGSRVPFYFFTDFLGSKAWVKPASEIAPEEVDFQINHPAPGIPDLPDFTFQKHPLSPGAFSTPYQYVVDQINIGNSYLVNLTFKTPVTTDLSLHQIFQASKARYKVRYRDQFVVFSPETFVKTEGRHIYSYPMKGTIDAGIPHAAEVVLSDPKETAEHVTIVDLIRNDLSQIASQVEVSRFRFISEVTTHEKKLLQVSSEIRGVLPMDFHSSLGTLLFQLLPAGSISGAPKKQTLEIIRQAESYERGFYTGICGHFDGESLDTGVMIRFIENEGGQLYYKSGGGITSFSQEAKEYQEIIDKIYLPIH